MEYSDPDPVETRSSPFRIGPACPVHIEAIHHTSRRQKDGDDPVASPSRTSSTSISTGWRNVCASHRPRRRSVRNAVGLPKRRFGKSPSRPGRGALTRWGRCKRPLRRVVPVDPRSIPSRPPSIESLGPRCAGPTRSQRGHFCLGETSGSAPASSPA